MLIAELIKLALWTYIDRATNVSAKDVFHNAVKSALQKDGWVITHDPFFIKAGPVQMYIDLGAEKLIAAKKDKDEIAVEVKSFVGPSAIAEFHTALGQSLNYRFALEKQEPARTLYLAVPQDAYDNFFEIEFIQQVVERYQIQLIIFDPDREVILQWKYPSIET